MRTCQECGVDVKRSDTYCPECGKKLPNPDLEEQAVARSLQDLAELARKMKTFNLLKIGMLILIIVIIVSLVSIYESSHKWKGTEEYPSQQNILENKPKQETEIANQGVEPYSEEFIENCEKIVQCYNFCKANDCASYANPSLGGKCTGLVKCPRCEDQPSIIKGGEESESCYTFCKDNCAVYNNPPLKVNCADFVKCPQCEEFPIDPPDFVKNCEEVVQCHNFCNMGIDTETLMDDCTLYLNPPFKRNCAEIVKCQRCEGRVL